MPDWEKELSEEGLLEKQKEQEEQIEQFERQKKGGQGKANTITATTT